MNLSKRLQCVAANVMSNGVVADIGCDHGFTSIYLVQSGRAVGAIALDINQGPLQRAKEHVEQYGMSDCIKLRLSDGAKEISAYEADTILISGMGGALICRILRESQNVIQSSKELVLSPQSEIHLVRKCIHEMGFLIAQEEMVKDQDKYYVVMRAVPGQEVYSQNIEYMYGKKLIEQKSLVYIEFLRKEERRVNRIIGALTTQNLSKTSEWKKRKVEEELAQIHEVMNRMCIESE